MKKMITNVMAVVMCAAVLMTGGPVVVRAEDNFGEFVEEVTCIAEVTAADNDVIISEADVDAASDNKADVVADVDAASDNKANAESDDALNSSNGAGSEEKLSFTERLAAKFASSLGKYIPSWLVVLIVSMMPILELRAGLFVAKFLNLDLFVAIPVCVIGNIIPIPFILFFIKKIFKLLGKTKLFHKLIDKLEKRAMKKSSALSKGEFWGLVLFVGIPIPGTGAWMGSLIAALLEIDIKKAIIAELVGIVIATIIVSILSYGLLGIFI